MNSSKRIIYLLLCLGCFAISFNIAALTAVLPFISIDFNITDIYAQKIIYFYMIPYGLSALIYAPLTKFFSYRKVLMISMFFYGLSSLGCAISESFENILIFRIFMGVNGAGVIPLGLMVIGEIFDKEVRGRLVGVFFGCSFISTLIGVFISGWMSWRILFYVPALVGVFVGVGQFFIKSKFMQKVHGSNINYLKALGNVRIRNVFLFVFFLSAFYHGVHKWYGVYLNKIYHLDKLAISLIITCGGIAGFLGQILGGLISDKKDRATACYIGLIGLSISIVLLYFKFDVWIIAALIAIISMFWTIGHNGISTMLTDFPENDRPIIASLNSSIRFTGGGLGLLISTFFIKYSFSLTFLILGILIGLLIFILKKIILCIK